MKKIILLLTSILPLFLYAQDENKGIHFEQNLGWQQILQKAKTENKYIFVDCYATWCGPCKEMDRNIYPLQSIGDQMNGRFISVKVQMDVTGQDDERTKSWYAYVDSLAKHYKITAYPNFLFFSPDGELVHQQIGDIDEEGFIALSKQALNPQKQYYTLLKSYQSGASDYKTMPRLVIESMNLAARSFSRQIACDYIHNYLEKVNEKEIIFTEDNLLVAGFFSNCWDSKSKVMEIFLHNAAKIDSATHRPGFATKTVSRVIYRDEIAPIIYAAKKGNNEPDWEKITSTVRKRYGNNYIYSVFLAEIDWYKEKKQWKNYIKYIVLDVEAEKDMEGKQMDFLYLNNNACEVFTYSDNKQELDKALSWVDRALAIPGQTYTDAMDTKANLLYKLGKKTAAIALEEQAVKLAPKDKTNQVDLEKMKKGEPTW